MQSVPAKILKVAREFLGLSQDDVEGACGVSRRTIQRIEQGQVIDVGNAFKLQLFYITAGITFVSPTKDQGWGVFNVNTKDDPAVLNKLKDIPPGRRYRSAK